MSYNFGFKPSEKLSNTIDEAEALVHSDSNEPYYPFRNDIAQQIAYELIENFLSELVSVIPDEDRKRKLTKIIGTIEGAAEKMLNILLSKDKNEDVIPNIEYLENETVFDDNDGNRRIGFELSDDKAQAILDGFNSVTPENADIDKLTASLRVMSHAILQHFIVRFSETLPLGMIKRKSVPIAKSAISKALDIAINKIVPGLPLETVYEATAYYKDFMVKKD